MIRLPRSADTGMSEISTDAAPGLAVEGAPIEMLADETAGPGDGIWRSAQARASPRLSEGKRRRAPEPSPEYCRSMPSVAPLAPTQKSWLWSSEHSGCRISKLTLFRRRRPRSSDVGGSAVRYVRRVGRPVPEEVASLRPLRARACPNGIVADIPDARVVVVEERGERRPDGLAVVGHGGGDVEVVRIAHEADGRGMAAERHAHARRRTPLRGSDRSIDHGRVAGIDRRRPDETRGVTRSSGRHESRRHERKRNQHLSAQTYRLLRHSPQKGGSMARNEVLYKVTCSGLFFR